tara:strand:+ start:36 stop:629 length:594 start_codon:yes stop_codon:yes gene_type:complete
MPVGATVAAAGITSASLLGSTKMQNSASANAANIQARSAANAARIRNQFDEKQLKYLQAESSLTRQQDEINRRANFGQWDTDASNLYNRNRDALLNNYGINRAQSLTNVDLFNANARNQRTMYAADRDDTNLGLSRKDARMSHLGALLGIPERDPLQFNQLDALREGHAFDPGKPIITDREKTKYVTGVPLTDKSRV